MCSSSCLLWMLLSLSVRFILSFYCLFSLRNLHSFPTRRSSDLLTNEIESLYVLTKDFLKARTNDLESFKELFGVFVGKVKEKAPRGLFVRQHERSEEKKNTFSLQDVLQRDRELREQRKAKRKKSHDLER